MCVKVFCCCDATYLVFHSDLPHPPNPAEIINPKSNLFFTVDRIEINTAKYMCTTRKYQYTFVCRIPINANFHWCCIG